MRKLNSRRLRENIEKRINADIEACRVGGATVSVMQNDEIVYEGIFGVKNCETGEELKPDTIFRIASMTKPVTAAAVLIEMSRKHLSVDDLVSDYLPEYGDMDVGRIEDGRPIVTGHADVPLRIYHLLSHTSGIATGNIGDLRFMMSPEQKSTMQGVVGFYAGQPLGFEPLSAQMYSTTSFDVAARIIELTSGMPFDRYLEKELYAPLGMKDTTFAPTPEQFGRLICLHNLDNGRSVNVPGIPGCVFGDYALTYTGAGAGLASTLKDYQAFAQMLLHRGDGIIAPELVDRMASQNIPSSIMPGNQKWGLGVRVITEESYRYLPVGTFGWSGAYGTHFWVDPADSVTAVYMKNSVYDGGSGAVTAANFEKDVEEAFE